MGFTAVVVEVEGSPATTAASAGVSLHVENEAMAKVTTVVLSPRAARDVADALMAAASDAEATQEGSCR